MEGERGLADDGVIIYHAVLELNLTVTKMGQRMGHIAHRSLRNLTKCCTIDTKFIYLVKLRRLRLAMCTIFCHILVRVRFFYKIFPNFGILLGKFAKLWFHKHAIIKNIQ